jgi:ornithine carbamoyltransferase
MYDGIQYRGHGQEVVETLAQYAGVPVWNGLTNEFHPTQLLADLLTMQEHLPGKAFNQMTLVYAGDARNNMGNSMLEAAALTGLDLRLVAPSACWPESAGGNLYRAGETARRQHHPDGRYRRGRERRRLYLYRRLGLDGRGQGKWAERIALLRDYQVNSAMMALTGNPQVKFLHCLPAFHDDQTTLGKQMAADYGLHGGMEVTDEVFESAASMVFRPGGKPDAHHQSGDGGDAEQIVLRSPQIPDRTALIRDTARHFTPSASSPPLCAPSPARHGAQRFMHFAGIKHHKVPFVKDHRFLLLASARKAMSFSASQSVCGSPAGKVLKVIPAAAEHNLDIEIAGMIFRAARGLRLGGVFGNQIKQVVAVDIVFTQRRRLADMGDNVFDSLAQRGRQPRLQMVDIANNHRLPQI